MKEFWIMVFVFVSLGVIAVIQISAAYKRDTCMKHGGSYTKQGECLMGKGINQNG